MQAETGIKYTQHQWQTIDCIWDHLESLKSPASDFTDPKDQDPKLMDALMCLCTLVVM
jgi:hypothetical protein